MFSMMIIIMKYSFDLFVWVIPTLFSNKQNRRLNINNFHFVCHLCSTYFCWCCSVLLSCCYILQNHVFTMTLLIFLFSVFIFPVLKYNFVILCDCFYFYFYFYFYFCFYFCFYFRYFVWFCLIWFCLLFFRKHQEKNQILDIKQKLLKNFPIIHKSNGLHGTDMFQNIFTMHNKRRNLCSSQVEES